VTDSGPDQTLYDLVIIGGGIVGCGIARDAALRGLTVALVEKHDFGSGTTSGSTRLIHGGLRYLATGDFALVRLDLREREILLRIAPHLVAPLPFLLPLPKGWFGRLRLRIGMWLYDVLSYDKSLPRHRILSPAELHAAEPGLDTSQFHGAAVFYDAQCASPERLALENVIDAHEHGAFVQNYAEVVGGIHDGDRLVGVKVKKTLTGDVRDLRGRVIVNASGPWFDRVAARVEPSSPPPRLRTTKGIHIACEPFTSHAIFLESSVDGRAVFAIPWMGHTWVGTTDTDFDGDPAAASATEEDVRYLVDSLAPQLPAIRSAKKYWTGAGVRALVRSDGSPSGVSRMHRLTTDTPGLISVIGGKLTGYRAIAEEVVDRACSDLRITARCTTATTPLPGGGPERSGVPHLDALYGSRAPRVQAFVAHEPSLGTPLAATYPDTRGQVAYAARHEWAEQPEDFTQRRSFLGFQPDQGRAARAAINAEMSAKLSQA